VHRGSGQSEESSAATLPHADPRHASEPHTHTHTQRYADIQTHTHMSAYTHVKHTHTHTHTHCPLTYTQQHLLHTNTHAFRNPLLIKLNSGFLGLPRRRVPTIRIQFIRRGKRKRKKDGGKKMEEKRWREKDGGKKMEGNMCKELAACHTTTSVSSSSSSSSSISSPPPYFSSLLFHPSFSSSSPPSSISSSPPPSFSSLSLHPPPLPSSLLLLVHMASCFCCRRFLVIKINKYKVEPRGRTKRNNTSPPPSVLCA